MLLTHRHVPWLSRTHHRASSVTHLPRGVNGAVNALSGANVCEVQSPDDVGSDSFGAMALAPVHVWPSRLKYRTKRASKKRFRPKHTTASHWRHQIVSTFAAYRIEFIIGTRNML